MNSVVLLFNLLFTLTIVSGTLSPTKEKSTKKEKERKFGPVDKDVYFRGLVKTNPKVQDILRESGLYCKDTKYRNFKAGEVLGYITPWNGEGYDNAKRFHGKFDLISPVWITINSRDPFKVPPHDIQKKWLHEMKAYDNENHTVKILPRILFEGWSNNDINDLYNNLQKRDKLMKALINLCETYNFNGYILEIWNQFVFAGAKKKLIIDIVASIADELRIRDFDIILAIPPWRGMDKELFSKKNFDALAPHVRYFSLMTYDFSSVQRPGPNAPVDWIRKCIEYLVPNVQDVQRAQILMGLNFYGYHYTPSGGGPIVSTQYLKLLEDFKGKIQFDSESEEHFLEIKNSDGGYVFFPTLYSIRARIDLAHELKIGISIWELGQGLTYFFDLL